MNYSYIGSFYSECSKIKRIKNMNYCEYLWKTHSTYYYSCDTCKRFLIFVKQCFLYYTKGLRKLICFSSEPVNEYFDFFQKFFISFYGNTVKMLKQGLSYYKINNTGGWNKIGVCVWGGIFLKSIWGDSYSVLDYSVIIILVLIIKRFG